MLLTKSYRVALTTALRSLFHTYQGLYEATLMVDDDNSRDRLMLHLLFINTQIKTLEELIPQEVQRVREELSSLMPKEDDG